MNDIEKDILNRAKGVPLNELFRQFQIKYGDIYEKPEIKEMFLEFMTKIVESGELRLALKGKYLEGTPQEQIDKFRQAWPESYDKNDPDKDIDLLWWFCQAPAGAVWIYPDGYEEWT